MYTIKCVLNLCRYIGGMEFNMDCPYMFKGTENVITPALIYYKDKLMENLEAIIKIAGGAEKLWPHVKTHKMENVIKLQMSKGINKFKCATIAEAEMVANCGAYRIIIAYPLVGPNITRFLDLQKAYPSTEFFAIGDSLEQLELLGKKSQEAGIISKVLIDVNMGMNRTGIGLDGLSALYSNAYSLDGISVQGLHCYDGHQNEKDVKVRKASVDSMFSKISDIAKEIQMQGLLVDILVMGGTPTFPCYGDKENIFFSPGTLFVNDSGYHEKFPDLNIMPAASILTRVVSNPEKGLFTLDLGYKGIASDPVVLRGKIVGLENYEQLFQSEEHWVFKMKDGYEHLCPKIGSEFFVIPTHICPTSALYPSIIIVENNEIIDEWDVTARNRKITY